jgi:hypothetical protein
MKPRPIEYDDLIGRLFTEPDLVLRPIEKYGFPEKGAAKPKASVEAPVGG